MREPDERLRLLVVDDDEVDRMAVRRAIEQAGLEADIEELDTAEAVLDRADEDCDQWDCAIVDYELPGATAAELIRELRGRGVKLPIVVLTGHGSEEIAVDVMRSGASDYLSKHRLSSFRLGRRVRSAVMVGRAEERVRRVQRDLAAERRLLHAVLEQMPVGVVVARAPTGEIVLQNRPVEQILGGPMSEEANNRVCTMAGQPLEPGDWPLARAIDTGDITIDRELICRHPEGRLRYIHASAGPVVDQEGRRVAAVMTLHDVTGERAAQRKAERAAMARKEMLSIVSHDVRGPLNAIGIAAEELGDPELDDDERRHYVRAISRGVVRANRLIRDLLDVDKIDAGALELERVPVDPENLLSRGARDAAMQAEQRGVSLDVEVGADVGKVEGDPERLRQALQNLIGNALDHTPRGGRVALRAVRQGDRVRFDVVDSGRGIPEDQLPHIFDRYYQAGRRRRGHAGLGLSIVKGIIEAHGGAVGVESDEDVGSTFWFSLPVSRS